MRSKYNISKIVVVISFLMLVAVATLIVGNIASVKRTARSLESNVGGGLNRVATLYDYNGRPLKQWNGKIDMSNSTNEVDFFIDNKRIIIHGGIFVLEEK
jgi:hypothetical protein